MRILIVDDHPINLKVLRVGLQAEGLDVVQASTADEAWDILERQNGAIDGIVSDIQLPGMDGYAFCRKVRSDERFASLAFVFYSMTRIAWRDQRIAREAGADAFLTKPAPADRIAGVLAEIALKKASVR